jgi:hypothetical protein
VPAAAIGPARALVPPETSARLKELRREVVETWLVGGVGRVLPGRLYDAAAAAALGTTGGDVEVDEETTETCSLERFDRVAGPHGVERVPDAVARIDCPIVPELMRPLT